MDSSTEKTPRKKNRKKDTQLTPQQENFTPFVLKIATIDKSDLPTERDYFFANKSTLTKHGLLIGQPLKLTPLSNPHKPPYICHPWPVDSINRNCIAFTQVKLDLIGVEEGDSVQLEKIEFGVSNATLVRVKVLSEMDGDIDEATCGYLVTQLSGKYVCKGSKFKVSKHTE